MARPRAADYDQHRDRILERAVSAFADTGYASASMAALARACGVSKAGLYHYYPSKEALLFDALDRHTRRLAEIVDAARAQRLPARDELRALVRGFLAEYRHSRAYHVALLNDVKFLDARHRAPIVERERAIVEAFADAIGRGWPGRTEASLRKPLTMALLGTINFTFAWFRPDGPVSHERFAELVIELWERGLDGTGTQAHSGIDLTSKETSR